MDLVIRVIPDLLFSGLSNLAAYLAAHVLLCLLPAFFIAGAMTAFIPKEMITRYLGRNTPKYISYPAAAAAGFMLAVCSCTIVPLFAGIYKKGAGLGPAITFLFTAPAMNILAIAYTGTVIGYDMALARLAIALVFGISIGFIMSILFRKEDQAHDKETDALFAGKVSMRPATLVFLLTLVVLLVIGTFQVDLLKDSYFQFELPIHQAKEFNNDLSALIPYDPSKGEEGVTIQGVILIGTLPLIGFTGWLGIEKIHEHINGWTGVSIGLVGITLLFASMKLIPVDQGLLVAITGKTIGVLICIVFLAWLLKYRLSRSEIRDFLWESWKFIKQIFPLLIVGVFIVGVIRGLIKPEWIETVAGRNTLLGNLAGVIFGVFMYFPTLVEVTIAKMFLGLGMHRGPLLAYLMSDPELSLQSILITSTIIGKKKAWVYVGLVALFSTLAGLMYGAWMDGFGSTLLVVLTGSVFVLMVVFLFFKMKKVKKRG